MSLGMGGTGSHEGYAKAALDRECEIAAGAGHGRNDQLNRSAFSIGQLVGAGLIERDEAERRLLSAAEANGYTAKDGPGAARATICSGLDKGVRQPRSLPESTDRLNGHGYNGSGRAHFGEEMRPSPRPSPKLHGVPLPDWTEPDSDGRPNFAGVGETEPPKIRDEVPGRRHIYRRDGEAVRAKIKKASGSAYIDMYKVRRPDTGEVCWQARKPAQWVPVPYVGAGDPFHQDMSAEALFWAEGEKDVDTLVGLGLAAFTFGGSSDVPPGSEELLRGRDVVVVADNDDPGRSCADRKAAISKTAAKRVRVLEFPELEPGGDISDFVLGGGTVDQIWARIDATQVVEKPVPKFVLEPLSSIQAVLNGSWLIKGLLCSTGLAVIYGPPGCGKSFVGLDVALHIAAGREWAGRRVKQTGVVYVASEGGSGFRKRVAGARDYHRIAGDAPFTLVVTPPNLGTEQGDAPLLIQCIREQCADLGFKPGIVILDTLARSMAGADENNAKDMGVFVANAGVIERELDVLVLAVHHTGKDADRGMRGSSALHGATAAEWEIISDEIGKSVRIAKMKDGEDDLSFGFRLHKVDVGHDEDGDPVTTLVTEVLGEPKQKETSGRKGRAPLKGQAAEFMKAVSLAIEASGQIPPTSNHIPGKTKCVSRHDLMAYADKLGFVSDMVPKSRKTTLDRHIRTLCGNRYLGQWGDWIWVAS